MRGFSDIHDLPLFEPRPVFPTKEEALNALGEKHTAYIAQARGFALRWLETHPDVTVDVIREHVPPPEGSDGRLMGAIFKPPLFRKIGNRRSERIECHKREVSVFVRSEA